MSRGKTFLDLPTASRATWTSSCTGCPTARRIWKNSRTWQGSRRRNAGAPELTTGTDDYSPDEMMAAVAARELQDGEVVFVGIGLPNLACNLARATHAPRLVLLYESGALGAVPERLRGSIVDPALRTGSLQVLRIGGVFQSIRQNG